MFRAVATEEPVVAIVSYKKSPMVVVFGVTLDLFTIETAHATERAGRLVQPF